MLRILLEFEKKKIVSAGHRTIVSYTLSFTSYTQ